jgi:hypothetical protein
MIDYYFYPTATKPEKLCRESRENVSQNFPSLLKRLSVSNPIVPMRVQFFVPKQHIIATLYVMKK